MAKRISKVFRVSNVVSIPVTIELDGSVNVGATGDISARDFARLAASVICESNTISREWVGFPVCNDLADWDRWDVKASRAEPSGAEPSGGCIWWE